MDKTKGSIIRIAREEISMSQEELAHETKISQSTINQIENCERRASAIETAVIAHALGTTVGHLNADSEIRRQLKHAQTDNPMYETLATYFEMSDHLKRVLGPLDIKHGHTQ